MKISQSALQLGYEHQKNTSLAQQTDRNVRILDNNPTTSDTTGARAGIKNTQEQTLTDTISVTSQSLVTDTNTGEASYFESAEFLQAVSSVLVEEDMTVAAVQTLDNGRVNTGSQRVEITSITQFESDTNIQANALGVVTTEDGREIEFLLELTYDRNIKTTQESIFTGERNLTDPLVINLNGSAPSLSDQYFEFDLNSDGETESLNQTAHGTGFLALDKNGNGEIDNGQELFGPNSNSGFGELAQYDDDDNGWIDENDAIFSQLSFMDFDENGEQRLRSIGEAGLGALYLGSEEMDLDLFDSDGNFQANIARNGVALKETGHAVSLQEIHYAGQAQENGRGAAQMEEAKAFSISADLVQNGTPINVAQTINSTQTLSEALSPVRIESALTQFQFDDEVLNARNADTQVTISVAEQNNFIVQNGIRNRSDLSLNNSFSGPSGNLNMSASFTIGANTSISRTEETRADLSANGQSMQASTSTQRREEIQSIFQARFEAGVTFEPVNTASNSTQDNRPKIDVPTLSQSIFWQDNRQQYQDKYEEGSKLDQLKQLVADLKDIREQQKESQEKIGIYNQVGNYGLNKP